MRLLAIYAWGFLLGFSFANAFLGSEAPSIVVDSLETLAKVARFFERSERAGAPEAIDATPSTLTNDYEEQLAVSSGEADSPTTNDVVQAIRQRQRLLMADMNSIATALDGGPALARQDELRARMRNLIIEYKQNLRELLVAVLRSYGQTKEEAEAALNAPTVSAALSFAQAAVVGRFKHYT